MIGNEAARGTEFQALVVQNQTTLLFAIYTINWRTYGLHLNFLKWISKNSVLTTTLMSTAWQINWRYT
jgi:hypothetical protein